jgi:hypothetical protein
MKPAIALVTVMLLAPLLPADRRHAISDDKVDFSAVKTDRPNGPSVIFDQTTVVIDMTAREGNGVIWHGVYTDDRSTPAKAAEKQKR